MILPSDFAEGGFISIFSNTQAENKWISSSQMGNYTTSRDVRQHVNQIGSSAYLIPFNDRNTFYHITRIIW